MTKEKMMAPGHPLCAIIAHGLGPGTHKHVLLSEGCLCAEPPLPNHAFAHRWETDEDKETIRCRYCGYEPKAEWHPLGGCDECEEIAVAHRKIWPKEGTK